MIIFVARVTYRRMTPDNISHVFSAPDEANLALTAAAVRSVMGSSGTLTLEFPGSIPEGTAVTQLSHRDCVEAAQ
jgi:hypothetical protein